MNIKRLTTAGGDACGARVSGVQALDLSTERLEALVAEHQVVAFQSQTLNPATLTELASRLGAPAAYPFTPPLEGYPHVCEVRKEADDEANFGGAWHTDSSYLPKPPAYTLLQALTVPPRGGDTLFASGYAACESLSDGMRELLTGLRGVNTSALVHSDEGEYSAVGQFSNTKQFDAETSALHPVLRRHPVTGRASLYVSTIHTSHFAGMTRAESAPIIDYLQSWITRDSNVMRLSWEPGMVAIWDNRCLQHFALNDYAGHRRVMHRVIVEGEVPLGFDTTGEQR